MKDLTPMPESIPSESVGISEAEIENFFVRNPSSLGLGEVEIIGSQINQELGILDILAFQSDQNTYYEIEIMRGLADSSHISRSLDYWAREREVRGFSNHVAVLISESCRGRYGVLLRTLPLFVPIIVMEFGIFKSESDTYSLKCEPIFFPDRFDIKKIWHPVASGGETVGSKTSLLLIAHFLANPALATAPVRDISHRTGISLGQISNIMKLLLDRGWMSIERSNRTICNIDSMRDYYDNLLRAFPEKVKYIKQRISENEQPENVNN